MELTDHQLVSDRAYHEIRYERRPARDVHGNLIPDLYNAWIWLNNPSQLNSYTTEALRELILAFRQASCDRAVVCTVFTGVGDRAFCSGGNTKQYAEYYAGRPAEYPAGTCGCSTTSSRASSPATSRSSIA